MLVHSVIMLEGLGRLPLKFGANVVEYGRNDGRVDSC